MSISQLDRCERMPDTRPMHGREARERRVVLLVQNLPVPLDRRVWQEAQALRAAGWRVTVISPRSTRHMRAAREVLDGIEILRYPNRPAKALAGYFIEYLPAMLFSLALLIRARLGGCIDIIHGCNPPDLFWILGLVGRAFGARYVYDQHDVNPELAATKFGSSGLKGRLLGGLTRWLEQRSYDTADLVIAPNDSYAEIARSRGGVAADRVVVVRNAPDLAETRRLARGTAPDLERVGYVGVMNTQDGLPVLLRAWSLVREVPELQRARLELVGDGEARPELERMAAELGLGDSVRFHGYRRPSEFVPVLAECSVCVSPDPPSQFNDVSTMVKVVDYLAIGRPIVAFDLLETRRVAGDAVRIVTPATPEALAGALSGLLSDRATVSRMADAASARADELNLDWSASAARLVDAYDALVAPATLASDARPVSG